MWTETDEGRQYVKQISKGIIDQVAPEESDLFDDLITDYFQNPVPPDLSDPGKDDPLGFGLGEILIAATPAAAAIVSSVLNYLMTEAVKTGKAEAAEVLKQRIKSLFHPEENKDKAGGNKDHKDIPPLTREQLVEVKRIVHQQAAKFGLSPGKAELMAAATIGTLALA